MTELQNNRITDLQKDRQGKSSIAPTFSKRGYNYNYLVIIFFYRPTGFGNRLMIGRRSANKSADVISEYAPFHRPMSADRR